MGGNLQPGVAASSGIPMVDKMLGMGGDAFTAHPKMDPKSKALVGFSWKSGKQGVELKVLAFDEKFRRLPEREPDSAVVLETADAQPHDFGLTDKWCVFLENQLEM